MPKPDDTAASCPSCVEHSLNTLVIVLADVLLQGAKGVEKGKGQLFKQQEKRKRAEDKANTTPKKKCVGFQSAISESFNVRWAMPLCIWSSPIGMACSCSRAVVLMNRGRAPKQGSTLDGWLTAGGATGGGADASSDMPPLLLPRAAALPPLLLPSEDGQTTRPAKKRKCAFVSSLQGFSPHGVHLSIPQITSRPGVPASAYRARAILALCTGPSLQRTGMWRPSCSRC